MRTTRNGTHRSGAPERLYYPFMRIGVLALSIALGLFGATACSDGPSKCTADAVESNGVLYGRSPDHGCKVVDSNGSVLSGQ
jgi:hypothetical protein